MPWQTPHTPGGSDQLTTGVCYYYLLLRMSGCHDIHPIGGQPELTPANHRATLHLRWSHVTAGWPHTGQVVSSHPTALGNWGLSLSGPISAQPVHPLTNHRNTFLTPCEGCQDQRGFLPLQYSYAQRKVPSLFPLRINNGQRRRKVKGGGWSEAGVTNVTLFFKTFLRTT